jgi:hypothetical protein
MVCTACLAVNVSCISGRSKILAVEAGTLSCTACLVLVDYYLAWSAVLFCQCALYKRSC